jgi:uncharacterized protein YcfL
MIKLKHIILVAIASIFIYACSSNNGLVDEFDHEGQAVIDNDTLVKYLTNHYYDATIDSIKPLITGETALIDDSKLKTQDITENDIDYKLYYYVEREGTPAPKLDVIPEPYPERDGFPTVLDSILVTYHLGYLSTATTYEAVQELNTATWFDPITVFVRGWLYGFTHFKGGENNTVNGPITYENGGKGVLIIPSGLAYRNLTTIILPANSNLIYYVNLFDVAENTDHDLDGLPSYLEIEDATVESDPRFVDTDGDLFANYRDSDDDNDGVLTKDEDTNDDGDPRNDFSDPSNPTVPDYLNRNIK